MQHRHRSCKSGPRSCIAGLLACVCALFAGIRTLPAQIQTVVALANGPAADDDQTPKTNGFSVRKEDQKVTDALSEFERYCGKEAWEKAFASLATAADAKPTGLIAARDGFYLPTRIRVRQALCALSPAGRAAYRLFNDAKAKQQFEKIGVALTPADISALRKLTDQNFVSSIGDQAADRLADALFESGDFQGAAGYWQAILTDYPDSSLSPVRLQTKRAIALARAGDRIGFDAALATIRERYAGQKVLLGGKEVTAADYVATLAVASTTEPSSASLQDTTSAPKSLPAEDAPAWQMPVVDDQTNQQVQQQLNNMGWANMGNAMFNGVLPVDMDDRRVYANWLGVCFAVDLRTGKLLWRSDKFTDQIQHFPQMAQQGLDGSGDAVIAAGDRVLFVRRDPKSNDYNAPHQLICLAADSGKPIWGSGGLLGLKEITVIGAPIVVGQTVYAISNPQQNQEENLLAISLKDGRALWSMAMGTPTQTQNYRGMQVTSIPTLATFGGKIYVLTNNGALLSVDPTARLLEWALTFVTRPPADPRFGFNPYMQQQGPHMPGAVVLSGGTLYAKEADNDTLFAIDPTVPALKWRRPIDRSGTMIGSDGSGMMLLGDDFSYMSLGSRDLLWSARLPSMAMSARTLLSPRDVCVFTSRGIYDLDATNGDTRQIFRGYDHEAVGGALWHIPGRLIAVSNRAITAYPVPGEQMPPLPATEPTTAPASAPAENAK